MQLRAQGLSLAKIGAKLGISAQGVDKLLKTAHGKAGALARIEGAARTMQDIAEETRSALAEVARLGAARGKRRLEQIKESDSGDQSAKTVLEASRIAGEIGKTVHGWGAEQAGGGARIQIGLVGDMRGLKAVQVADGEQVITLSDGLNVEGEQSGTQEKAVNP